MDINALNELKEAARKSHISSSKLGEDYIVNYSESFTLYLKLQSAINLYISCFDKAEREEGLLKYELEGKANIKSPKDLLVNFFEYNILNFDPPLKIKRALDKNGNDVYGDIYFIETNTFEKLMQNLDTVIARLNTMQKSGSFDDQLKNLGYDSYWEFSFNLLKINKLSRKGLLNKYIESNNFFTAFNINENPIFDWLYKNFFEVNKDVISKDFILAAFIHKSDIGKILKVLDNIFSDSNLTNQGNFSKTYLSWALKEWFRYNHASDGKVIKDRMFNILYLEHHKALLDENNKIKKIIEFYNLDCDPDDVFVRDAVYNSISEQYSGTEIYIEKFEIIENIMISFLNENYENFVKNGDLDIENFFKSFIIYISNSMSDNDIFHSFNFGSLFHTTFQGLDDIKAYFKKMISINGANNLSHILSSKIYKDIYTNKEFLDIKNSSKNEELLDIPNSILNNNLKKNILLENKSSKGIYSFKDSMSVIESSIEDLKKRSFNFEKIISKDIINNFFDKLKDVLIRQLKQEDLFLQGKSTSCGMLDLIESNLKLRNPKTTTSYNLNENFYEDSYFRAFRPFHDEFFARYPSIFDYFTIFKDEADKFFSNNDINSIKASILKIVNFLNLKTSDNEIIGLSILKINNLNSEVHTSDGQNYYLMDIVNDIYKNDKKTTKKEYIQKIQNPLKLLHNFSNTPIFEKLIKSETLKKTHNINIFQLQNIAIPTLIDDEYSNTLGDLLNDKKIPTEYITDNIIKFFESSGDIRTSQDYDTAINYLIGDGSSESFRKAKFILGYVKNFKDISNWIDSAKPKDPAIFAPNLETEKFRFRVLKDFDPLHFSIGVETDCCQTIGGAGESAAIDSFINPYAGVLLLESKDSKGWQLAAQSYFHYAELEGGEKAIILDNIEAGKFRMLHKDNFYREAYATLGSYLSKSGFKVVGCGISYTEVISLNDFKKGSLKSDPRYFEIEEVGEESYTDFDNESFLDLTKPKFNFKQSENIIENEGELSKLSLNILSIYIEKYGSSIAKRILKISKLLEKNGFKKEAADTINIAIIK